MIFAFILNGVFHHEKVLCMVPQRTMRGEHILPGQLFAMWLQVNNSPPSRLAPLDLAA
jgi:hypothetical protein